MTPSLLANADAVAQMALSLSGLSLSRSPSPLSARIRLLLRHLDDSLDDTCFRLHPHHEVTLLHVAVALGERLKGSLVRDPWHGVDLALLHARDTLGEVLCTCIPRAHHGHLARVEQRVVVRNLKLGVPDEDEPTAVADILERALHRVNVASHLEHARREVAASNSSDRVDCLLWRIAWRDANGMLHSNLIFEEVQSSLHNVHSDHIATVRQRKLASGHAHRSRTDDQHPLAFLHGSSVHSVAANAESLNQRYRRLAARHLLQVNRVKLVHRAVKRLAEAAVHVHTHDAEVHAAVGLAALTRDAGAAVQVRLHRAYVAHLDVLRVEATVWNL